MLCAVPSLVVEIHVPLIPSPDAVRQKLAEMTSFAGTLREEYTRLDSGLEALLQDIRTVNAAGAVTLADTIAHAEDAARSPV